MRDQQRRAGARARADRPARPARPANAARTESAVHPEHLVRTDRPDPAARPGRPEHPDRPTSAPPTPSPAATTASLTDAQRLAGNQAVVRLLAEAAPVQRTILAKPTAATKAGPPVALTWAEVAKMSAVAAAAVGLRLVVRYWTESAVDPSPPLQFTTQAALVAAARATAHDMPAAFADTLSPDDFVSFTQWLKSFDKPATPAFAAALEARQRAIDAARVASFGPSPSLPAPTLDPRFHLASGLASRPAAATGRDDASWHSVTGNLAGVSGRSTGSTNLALAEQDIASGALQQHPGGRASQVCATCGHVTDATQFEVDHQQAFSDIRDNLRLLARAMTTDTALDAQIRATSSATFASWFLATGTPGTPGYAVQVSGAAVNEFSNDMANLMRICRRCNGAWGKSDMAIYDWYLSSPYFGDAFLDENLAVGGPVELIARTKSGEGWGAAARKWFETHHLAVLGQQFTLASLGRLLHERLTEQSTSAVRATREKDPAKRTFLEQRVGELQGSNAALLGGIAADERYFGGTPAPFAPGSPAMWEHDREEQAAKREKRKKDAATADTDPYRSGFDAGLGNLPAPSTPTYPDATQEAAFRQGHVDGRAEYTRRYDAGYQQALDVPDADALPGMAATLTDPAVAAGFRMATTARHIALTQGREHGRDQKPPDDSTVPEGLPSSERLLRDYLRGYREGRAHAGPTTHPKV